MVGGIVNSRLDFSFLVNKIDRGNGFVKGRTFFVFEGLVFEVWNAMLGWFLVKARFLVFVNFMV